MIGDCLIMLLIGVHRAELPRGLGEGLWNGKSSGIRVRKLDSCPFTLPISVALGKSLTFSEFKVFFLCN